MAYRIGQKIVCVNNRPLPGTRWDWRDRPEVGHVYTVRRSFIDDEGDEILWLSEIIRSADSRAQWGEAIGYAARRFRPVVERKTDISIFTEMLCNRESVA